ncbi:MAG: hypothetical protein KDD02_09715 [Phaeodactylibacter sp.]|nr:hypothetical protein [Phaeodactylibacter sp.]MCB9302614.1 hypothetical protein [Lewinellaceae bacterium]
MKPEISYSLHDAYKNILVPVINYSNEKIVTHLIENLPYLWVDTYCSQSNRLTDICLMSHGSFVYIFDDYASMEKKGLVPLHLAAESRVLAVFGKSSQQKLKRDDFRLRGWVGKTELFFGEKWDKGHFIAHSIGGAVDGLELNIFQQRRDLNRGWSSEGKIFRKMEKYCFENPGSFCFNRPIYLDQSSKPSFLEFGILRPDGKLWVEFFDNR